MKSVLKKAFLSTMGVCVAYADVFCQISDMNSLKTEITSGADFFKSTAKIVLSAVAIVALIGVVYMVATNNPRAKEAVIGWFVAVILIIIGIKVAGI